MRSGFFVALVLLAACGKSRVYQDEGAWDPPNAANGFRSAGGPRCGPASSLSPLVNATRTTPPSRSVWHFGSRTGPSIVATKEGCIASSAPLTATESYVFCVRTDGERLETVSHGLHDVRDIAVVGDHVFFVDDDTDGIHSRVLRDAGRGISNPDSITNEPQRDVRRLVGFGDDVFWIDDNRAIRGGHDGSSFKTYATHNLIDGRFLAVDDVAFYAVANGLITSFPRIGGSPVVMLGSVVSVSLRDLAVSGDFIYWLDRFGLYRTSRLPPHRQALVLPELDGDGGFTIAAGSIWVATCKGIVRIPVEGGSSPTLLPTGGSVLGRPVLDPVSFSVYALVERSGSTDLVSVVP